MSRALDLRTALAALWLAAMCGCISTAQIRVQNVSPLDFTDLSIAGQPYGDVAAGATTGYRSVDLKLGYAALKLWVNGRYVTGQTMTPGARRLTCRIDVEDLDKRHLAIEIVRD